MFYFTVLFLKMYVQKNKNVCSLWINGFTTFSHIQSVFLQQDFYAKQGRGWVSCCPGLNIDGLILQASKVPVCGGNLSSHSLREERNWGCSYGQKGSEGHKIRRTPSSSSCASLESMLFLWQTLQGGGGGSGSTSGQIKPFSTSKNWRSFYKTDVTDVVAKSSRIMK